MLGLDQRANVYLPNGVTGAYDVLARANLVCRLVLMTLAQEPGEARAEIDATRRLLHEPGYALPETARVELDGVRWSVRPGTVAAVRGLGGATVYRRADVVRVVDA